MPLRVIVGVFLGAVLTWGDLKAATHPTLPDPNSALQAYIDHDDGTFHYQVRGQRRMSGMTAFQIMLTSQQWRSPEDVSDPLWTHPMIVLVPDVVAASTGLLFVGSGSRDDGFPTESRSEIRSALQLASASNSVVAVLMQVPNQPLSFFDEPFDHFEDSLVAYSWDKAMDTGDYSWPAYLPMVKSVVRAMDALQGLAPTLNATLTDFVLLGFSKRGATAWLTAAVDNRVRAIAPGVIDFLNQGRHLEHHLASYGFYAPAVQDYESYGVLQRVRSPEGAELRRVVDPYSYRAKLDMPKYLINATGDQFFVPDSSRYYLSDLLGETRIRYVVNAGHSLSNTPQVASEVQQGLLAWYLSILTDTPRPSVEWRVVGDDILEVTPGSPPAWVRVSQAFNPNARDFRLGEASRWTTAPSTPGADGLVRVALPTPERGFSGTVVELGFPGPGGNIQVYSTRVFIRPDAEPFPIDEPIGETRPARYWQRQFDAAVQGITAEIDPATLRSYLPLPLANSRIATLEQGDTVMRGRWPIDALARRQCLTTRLNIQQGTLGWYSHINLPWMGPQPLWRHFRQAHNALKDGAPWISAGVCWALNAAALIQPPP